MLEFVVFVSGAVVMILELVASRLLAPYVGTSLVVWTSLIGVILGSLSLGYWWGGRLADRRPEPRMLSLILLAAAVLRTAPRYADRRRPPGGRPGHALPTPSRIRSSITQPSGRACAFHGI